MSGDNSSTRSITEAAWQYLLRMRPWLRVFSVFFGFYFGLMLLGGIGMLLLGGTGTKLMGAFYLAFGMLYWFPTKYLWSAADALVPNEGSELTAVQIETSLENQFKYWRYTGVLVAISIVISLVAVVLVMGLTMLGASLADNFTDVSTAVSVAS